MSVQRVASLLLVILTATPFRTGAGIGAEAVLMAKRMMTTATTASACSRRRRAPEGRG